TKEHTLCGHNIKEFDIPYICRRMLINGINLPSVLQISGKKPWEISFIDTLELWKFGDYKNYTSLKLLTAIFGIPTPKDDIDGSQVAGVYYKEKDIERIAVYCQKDVVATTQVFLRMNNIQGFKTENIEFL
ncbi:MAG: ribonuclease H-like domain-containing protein, partial [Paludibacter sp.]